MKIKEVSEKYGISPDTLRYYEKAGLILNVPRTKNGIRDYSEENCQAINFIKCMRSANISIEGLARYMELLQEGDATHDQRRQILVEERDNLAARIQHMQEALDHLNKKIGMYDAGEL